MDGVFRAIADPSRRALLDRLANDDGLPLGALCEVLPEMTRFGVMKHLRVLEEAHLVVTERRGRSKLHYLNPVPIQQIHDRWISRYATPFAAALSDLSSAAATNAPATDEEAGHASGQARVRDVRQSDAS
ncbi:MAG: helix-turn-helix domain-containing protein [Actinomycetota bacterium]